ncbi:hypothetical protein [Rhizobium binae]|uniref:hypothetical protein n=1 Tax=Rhizobium binae TaxID=1138190 RepID=UPI001FEF81E2|nr:hypothetical protein [Rhizobium binae]
MLSTERDFKRGGERFPIPSQGEVEGKLLMFELVAITCPEELFANSHPVSRLRRKLVRNLRDKCAPLKLCAGDEPAAKKFALHLLDAACKNTEDERRADYPGSTGGPMSGTAVTFNTGASSLKIGVFNVEARHKL